MVVALSWLVGCDVGTLRTRTGRSHGEATSDPGTGTSDAVRALTRVTPARSGRMMDHGRTLGGSAGGSRRPAGGVARRAGARCRRPPDGGRGGGRARRGQ